MASHPIDPWTFYAHSQATSNTYLQSINKIATVTTLEEWASVWNHSHPDLVGVGATFVVIHDQRILTWSLFRDAVLPEWEHPANANGITLTHRTSVDESDATRVWRDLVLEAIRGAFPDTLLGIQVTKKPARHTTFVRFDVWLSAKADPLAHRQALRALCHLEFTEAPRSSAPPAAHVGRRVGVGRR